uniref:Nef n=1 Tax=Human immunodeficiency virus type 1 TaxID=11676 RepID=Q74928_HV1|nr:nef [Human immunodeficiency virus 1]
MGGKWSKSSVIGWPTVRERIRRAEPAADGVGVLQELLTSSLLQGTFRWGLSRERGLGGTGEWRALRSCI